VNGLVPRLGTITRDASPRSGAGASQASQSDVVTDTAQQKMALRTNPVARKVRKRFAVGTRVEGAPGHYGTVERHVPALTALGGYLVVKWDNGSVGRHSAITLTVR